MEIILNIFVAILFLCTPLYILAIVIVLAFIGNTCSYIKLKQYSFKKCIKLGFKETMNILNKKGK